MYIITIHHQHSRVQSITHEADATRSPTGARKPRSRTRTTPLTWPQPETAGLTSPGNPKVRMLGAGGPLTGGPWDRSRLSHDDTAAKPQVKAAHGSSWMREDPRSPHLREASATRKTPQKSAFPQVRTILPGQRSGAGGTRTHSSDASHLRFHRRNGHTHLFPCGCILLGPARAGVVRRSPHRLPLLHGTGSRQGKAPRLPQPPQDHPCSATRLRALQHTSAPPRRDHVP